MSAERCYVLKDGDGDYWTEVTETRSAWQTTRPGVSERFTREEAFAAKKELAKSSRCNGGPLEGASSTVYKVIPRKPKPKPKAPREVFVVVNEYGDVISDFDGWAFGSAEEARENCEPTDRVVRYVLAEGE